MDCDTLRRQLGDYLDHEALDEICRAIEDHLSHCHDCRVEVDTVRKTIVLYQADREITTPVAVSARLEAALAHEYGRDPAADPKD